VEAAGVGLPRLSSSRMISRTRSAQSARNDRMHRCRYKTGTEDPLALALNRERDLANKVRQSTLLGDYETVEAALRNRSTGGSPRTFASDGSTQGTTHRLCGSRCR
jgi:hypothetical protein